MGESLNQSLESVLDEWRALRAMSLDLLDVATRDFLDFSPNSNIGTVWRQYRHLGRVQENYTAAIRSGSFQRGTPSWRQYTDNAQRGSGSPGYHLPWP